MNLSDMRTIVRRELHDEDSNNYRWTDNELDRHIARAVGELSEHLPGEQKAVLATTSGSREIGITSLTDRVMIEAVEYPTGQYPPRYKRFSLWGDTVSLLGDEIPDGGNANIYYGKRHTLDTQGTTIPGLYHDLVACGAEGYAAIEWAAYAINRVNTGGQMTPREFLDWGKEKLTFFRSELKRLGRRNRNRVSSLYRPYYPPVSQTTDCGP
jgi:hypothetical protein